MAVLILITSLNLLFMLQFTCKLRRLLSNNNQSQRFKQLILKNAILTITGALSTIVCYTAWYLTAMGEFAHLDILLNTLCISLMFKTNETHYHRLCGLCLWCTMKCNPMNIGRESHDGLAAQNNLPHDTPSVRCSVPSHSMAVPNSHEVHRVLSNSVISLQLTPDTPDVS